MEAGNRCFDFRVPEEINRRIVDHIADINLPYSSIARDYLLREGLPPEQIITTGSPMREVIEHNWDKILGSDVLARLELTPQRYFLVSLHREENVDAPDTLRALLGLLAHLAERYADPVVVSTHPRTRQRIDALGSSLDPRVLLHKPFGFCEYVNLQINARAVLSDSGTITEESSILNFPALNLREVHERPEGFEEASVMMAGLNADRVDQALGVLAEQRRGSDRSLRMVRDYEPTNVSDKVLRIILSYTDFVRRRVWGES
jgi:UDP-N-acetylglucosamine 2-epimerase (non-hydrolysing)